MLRLSSACPEEGHECIAACNACNESVACMQAGSRPAISCNKVKNARAQQDEKVIRTGDDVGG